MPGLLRCSALRPLLVACILAAAVACGERANPDPPDQLLQDSLGLTGDDRVHRVVLGTEDGNEFAEPVEVRVEPGAFVEFFTRDRRVRTVSFFVDSVAPAQADFLRSSGQDRSPPLVEMESRFLVSFEGAPEGRYPFLVEGNQRAIHGTVVVAAPEP